MTKWLVDGYYEKRLKKVEVLKRTEKTVTFLEPRNPTGAGTKVVNPDIFDTFEQAKDFLVANQEDRLKSLRLQLDRENGKLGQLKGLKNPDEKEGAK